MADTNGMKELIESAIQDIHTKYSYNTTRINDNYVLASLPEDCFYEVKSVSGRDHKWKAHVVTELKKEHVNEWIAAYEHNNNITIKIYLTCESIIIIITLHLADTFIHLQPSDVKSTLNIRPRLPNACDNKLILVSISLFIKKLW